MCTSLADCLAGSNLVSSGDNQADMNNELSLDIEKDTDTKLAFSAYPNPANNVLFISINKEELSDEARLVLYNYTGQQIVSHKISDLPSVNGDLKIDITSVTKDGLHYIRLLHEDVIKAIPIMIIDK